MNNLLKNKIKEIKLKKQHIYYKIILDNEKSNILDLIALSLDNGIKIIELSNKFQSSTLFYSLAEKTKLLTAQYDATLIIDDRIDIAYLIEADGVFLSNQSITPPIAKKLLSDNILIGTEQETAYSDYLTSKTIGITNNITTFVNADISLDYCKKLTNEGFRHILISDLITKADTPQEVLNALNNLF